MKKLLQIFILCMILSSTVFAANFEEINMEIELPEEYYDLKEAIDNNDTKITYYETLLKTTKEELKEQITKNNILYYGKNNDLSKTLIISMGENNLSKKIFHLHLALESEIEDLKESLEKEANTSGLVLEDITLYETNNVRWLESILRTANNTMHQYYTIINGKAITISLDELDKDVDVKELKDIIDTAEFSNLKEKAPDIINYIIIGVTVMLALIVVILLILTFSNKKEEN